MLMPSGGAHRTDEVFFFQCHDAQQGTFAGAVATDDANLRTEKEAQIDVFEHFFFWRRLC